MHRLVAALILLAACDKGAASKDDAAPKEEAAAPAAPSGTPVDAAALSALCIRGTLSVELVGSNGLGVLTDKKDGTKRYGWVAATMAPSAFSKTTAEQVSRELELQLKVADTVQRTYAATCTKALADANPVVLTFIVEQKATEGGPAAGFWVVAGTTQSRSIEFLAGAAAADARTKALELARHTVGATGFAIGKQVDAADDTPLCPAAWCDALG